MNLACLTRMLLENENAVIYGAGGRLVNVYG